MRSFTPGFIREQSLSPALVRALTGVAERKGRQELYASRAPQLLETLRTEAVIRSTESSNRIEGVEASPERLRDIVARGAPPRTRSEQEIAGYRDVLATIHASALYMEPTPGLVLQLHRDLYRYIPGYGGAWKSVDNEITETLADGSRRLRLRTLPAYATADAMRRLHEGFAREMERGEVEPLLLIGAYVLDFLCVHPFLDGNGRMARLLTLLLLYRSGYEVGRWISLEQLVERTREGYYDALFRSSERWHEGGHALLPWWEYFNGVLLLSAYTELEERVQAITGGRGAKREMIRDAVARLPARFRYADVERASPGVSRPTINRALAQLRREGRIRCLKPGRDAVWEKSGDGATGRPAPTTH